MYMAIKYSPEEHATAGCADYAAAHQLKSRLNSLALLAGGCLNEQVTRSSANVGFRTPLDCFTLFNGSAVTSFRKILA
jgi:hypothetical protein